MALTDTTIRNAKPAGKAYKLFDGAGLSRLMCRWTALVRNAKLLRPENREPPIAAHNQTASNFRILDPPRW